jgi:hypothetical protein
MENILEQGLTGAISRQDREIVTREMLTFQLTRFFGFAKALKLLGCQRTLKIGLGQVRACLERRTARRPLQSDGDYRSGAPGLSVTGITCGNKKSAVPKGRLSWFALRGWVNWHKIGTKRLRRFAID